MVAKATFSKYVGSLETEPVLKVWIMTYNDYDSWKQLAGDTPQEPTAGELIISYRKGCNALCQMGRDEVVFRQL